MFSCGLQNSPMGLAFAMLQKKLCSTEHEIATRSLGVHKTRIPNDLGLHLVELPKEGSSMAVVKGSEGVLRESGKVSLRCFLHSFCSVGNGEIQLSQQPEKHLGWQATLFKQLLLPNGVPLLSTGQTDNVHRTSQHIKFHCMRFFSSLHIYR